MPKYLLRAVKQVVVLQLTGEEAVVEVETPQQLNLAGIKFLQEKFGGDPTVELEIKDLAEKLAVDAGLTANAPLTSGPAVKKSGEPYAF